MIILRPLLLLTNLHLKLLSTQGTGADKLLSTQRVNLIPKNVCHFKEIFCSHFFNNGAISNIKPVLEWSDTVLSWETFKFDILLK